MPVLSTTENFLALNSCQISNSRQHYCWKTLYSTEQYQFQLLHYHFK